MPKISTDADHHDPRAVADETMEDADAAAILRRVAARADIPEHRRILIASLAAAIEAGPLADSTGFHAAVLVEHGPNPLFPDNDDRASRPA